MDGSRPEGGQQDGEGQDGGQAGQAGQTLVVAPDGSGSHRSLAAAVADAEPGATVRLAAGTHVLKRALLIRDSITLVGEGMDLTEVVGDRGEYVLRYEGRGLFGLRNLAVRWAGAEGRPADVVAVHGGEVLIEGCRFSGATSHDELCGTGLELKAQVRGSVLRCQMHGNGYGIVVGEQARPLLEGNTCRRNKVAGIAYFADAAGIARRNVCANNVESYGIYVLERAHPTLEDNVCRENKWTGIGYFDRAHGLARGNSCVANGLTGILVAQEARPELQANTCREQPYIGIAYLGTAAGTAHYNTCTDNGFFGIWLGERSRPKLDSNTCERNPRAGIYVTAEAWPVLPNFPGWDQVRRPH